MRAAALVFAAGSLLALSACAEGNRAVDAPSAPSAATAALATPSVAVAGAKPSASTLTQAANVEVALPTVLMHRSPTCGCCGGWAEHMRRAGFVVESRNSDDMASIKQRLGIPSDKSACHTSEIGGLVVEGHVPAEDIKRLLASNTKARGLILPGMPGGSPGMEMPDGRVQRYTVEQLNADGTTAPYAVHGN